MGHPRSKVIVPCCPVDLLNNIIGSMLLRLTVSEIEPFKVLRFELLILTLRGRGNSKVKMDLAFWIWVSINV